MGSLLTGFLLLLGSSCTEDIIAEQQTAGDAASGDLVPVEFTVGDVANLTRATSSIVTFKANEQVKVCVKPNGRTSYTGYNYTTASAGQTDIALTAPSTRPYFPIGQGTTVEAYAYYPNNASTSFSVQANQTADNYYKASDLMFAANRTITKGVNDGSNSLLMNHLMAQLHLNVTGQGVSINRVLVNCKRSVTFTPEAQTVVSTTGSASDIVAMTGSGEAYVLIPQQPVNTVTIKVETGSQNVASTTATFAFTATSDFESGKSYSINLFVNSEMLGVTTLIADWDGTNPLNVVKGLEISDIDSQSYTGSAVTPTATVTCMGTTLTEGTDYELVYANNINPGTATVYAVGKNTYIGKMGIGRFVIEGPVGVINGVFTVDKTGKQVMFSKGNLQATYDGSSWTWAFAEHQWDCIGNAEGNTKVTDTPPYVADYSGSSTTVDLFGWVGASCTWTGAAQYGITSSQNYNNINGYGNVKNENLKSDWGTLPITNGGNTANSGWFTLPMEAWDYLIYNRRASTIDGTANCRWVRATVNGIPGIILFPDIYTHPVGVVIPKGINGSGNYATGFNNNIYDATAWGKMEAAGAVFLPITGRRQGTEVTAAVGQLNVSAFYWTSTPRSNIGASESSASCFNFNNSSIEWHYYQIRYHGCSVRLVR